VVRLQCLESGKALAAVKIVYAGDPNLQQRILGCQQGVLNLLSGLRRNGILDQPNSIFKENPGGVALVISLDPASIGVRGVRIHTSDLHRQAVRPSRMSCLVGQVNGMKGGYPVQVAGSAKSVLPDVLIPAVPQDPFAGWLYCSSFCHPGKTFLESGSLAIHLAEEITVHLQMKMRIREARPDRFPLPGSIY